MFKYSFLFALKNTWKAWEGTTIVCLFELMFFWICDKKKYAQHQKDTVTSRDFLNFNFDIQEWGRHFKYAERSSTTHGRWELIWVSDIHFSLLPDHHNHGFMHRKLKHVLNTFVLSALNASWQLDIFSWLELMPLEEICSLCNHTCYTVSTWNHSKGLTLYKPGHIH